MIADAGGRIDYDDSGGAGPAVVLVPGSCSTDAAWRPVIANWDGQFRCITTSLLGYGQTAMQRANELLGTTIKGASLQTIADAAHFMVATHAGDVARAIAGLVRAEGA
jgi:hypothetical protein